MFNTYWYDGDAWRKTQNLWVYDAGAATWRVVKNLWIYNSGAWHQIFTSVPGPVDSVTITPSNTTVDVSVSRTKAFVYNAFDANGRATTASSVTWSTTDPSGSISSAGLYTAGVENGVYTVHVVADGAAANATVHVIGNAGGA